MMHFPMLSFPLALHFNIWNHVSNTCSLLSVYLGEKFTHLLMNQGFLEAPELFDVRPVAVVLPFEVMESSWTMITRHSCQSSGNTARGILFMKERFRSIPLESLCSRRAFANCCHFAASGRRSGFSYSATLNNQEISGVIKMEKLTWTMSWHVSVSKTQAGCNNKDLFRKWNGNTDCRQICTYGHNVPVKYPIYCFTALWSNVGN